MTVWPFPPMVGMIEVLEWSSDVLISVSAEQRIALREAPRRTFNFEHTLSDYELTGARGLVQAAQGSNAFMAPDWAQLQRIGPVSSGSSVYISADLTHVDMGEDALLWESPYKFEAVEIDVDSNGVVLASVANDYDNPLLIPLWSAVAPEGLSIDRIGKQMSRCTIAMTTTENTDLGFSTYETYRGHDVVPSCPVIGEGLEESIGWELSVFDNEQSKPYYLRARDYADSQFTMSWKEFGLADIYALRQWLHSRRGRQKAFWLSSRGHDFEPSGAISGTTVTVYRPPGAPTFAVPFDIDVTEQHGTSSYRKVTAVVDGTPVGGRATLDFTIDTTLSASSIKRISLMRCGRFAADRIEISHIKPSAISVRVPCVEVPVP